MTKEANLQSVVSTKSPPKKKRYASLDKRKARAGWLFVLPFVVGFLLIYLPIIFESIMYTFYKINVLSGGGYELEAVGFDNYIQALLVDPKFVQTLLSGLQELILSVPAILV